MRHPQKFIGMVKFGHRKKKLRNYPETLTVLFYYRVQKMQMANQSITVSQSINQSNNQSLTTSQSINQSRWSIMAQPCAFRQGEVCSQVQIFDLTIMFYIFNFIPQFKILREMKARLGRHFLPNHLTKAVPWSL